MVLAQMCCVVCEVKGLHRDVGWLALSVKILPWVVGIGKAVCKRSGHGRERIMRIWGPGSPEARRRRGSIEAIVRIHQWSIRS